MMYLFGVLCERETKTVSLQDKLEQILREIHVLIAEAQVYNAAENQIIIDKKVMYEHLNRLNVAIYEIMDEYELTQQSRDKAERDARKLGDDIVHQAERKAEDVYAASILYTNEALSRMQYIMQDAIDHFELSCNEAKELLEEEKRTVRSNQSELKGQLQDFQDTEKYLNLIRSANKQIEKERERERKEEQEAEHAHYTGSKPEIKVNPEYFERIGVPLDEEGNPLIEGTEEKAQKKETVLAGAIEEPLPDEEDFTYVDLDDPKPTAKPEIKVNLDSPYFQRMRNMKKP